MEIENTENNNTEIENTGNKYSHSKIYKICNYVSKDIYVGSTTLRLSARFSLHRKNARNTRKKSKLYRTMREIGIDKFSIFLIEEVKCKNRDELDKIEEQYRIKLNATLNKNKCYCELKGNDYAKKYNQENKEKLEKKSICHICRGKFSHANKSIHERSLKHHRAMENMARDIEFN
jgi:hypothetical protein